MHKYMSGWYNVDRDTDADTDVDADRSKLAISPHY